MAATIKQSWTNDKLQSLKLKGAITSDECEIPTAKGRTNTKNADGSTQQDCQSQQIAKQSQEVTSSAAT